MVFKTQLLAALGAALMFAVLSVGCAGEETSTPPVPSVNEDTNNGDELDPKPDDPDPDGEDTLCQELSADATPSGDHHCDDEDLPDDPPVPECEEDSECSHMEHGSPICWEGRCIDECSGVTCDEGESCQGGYCHAEDDPQNEEPCLNYMWSKDYMWTCPGFVETPFHVNLEKDEGVCVTDSSAWNPTDLPSEWIQFNESETQITLRDPHDPDFAVHCNGN